MATALRTAGRAVRLLASATDADAELRGALLHWYDAQARDLPWRRRQDAYAIWVSEVMLQQTQVAVVLRYWAPFLARFPTLQRLAAAPLDAVLAAWSGLGYYARARNLHRAACAVVERHGGTLPASAAALAELPGFGRYTVGAVASIAFGLPEPLVDGNVARVLSRLFALAGQPGEPERERSLWELARRLVPDERPGDWNQALMELGATLCRVARPSCLLCPARGQCQALALGQVELLSPPRAAPHRKPLRLAVAVARRGGRVLLGCRPARGLFGGLWELPSVEVPARAQKAEVQRALARLLGPGTRVRDALGEVHRTLTHRALTLSLFAVKPAPGVAKGGYLALRWVNAEQARRLGISAAMQAALAEADAGRPSPRAAVRGPKPSAARRIGRSRRAAGRLRGQHPDTFPQRMNNRMEPPKPAEAAARLLGAWGPTGTPLPAWEEALRPRSFADAYAIQDAVTRVRGPWGGWKVGAPSLEATPLCAPLYRSGLVLSPASLRDEDYRSRGIEAEVAFTFFRALPPRSAPYDRDEVLAAISTAHPGLEVVESRYAEPGKLDAFSAVADSQGHRGYVVGPPLRDWRGLDWKTLPVLLLVNGRPAVEHTGGNTSGDVFRLLVWLANEGSVRLGGIRAGDVVTTGSTTGLTVVPPGSRVVASFTGLGDAALIFTR